MVATSSLANLGTSGNSPSGQEQDRMSRGTLTVFSRMPHDSSWLWSKPHIIKGLNFYQVWDKGWCARDNVFGYIGHNHRRPFIITILLAPANFVLEAGPIRFKTIQGLWKKPNTVTVQPFIGIVNTILIKMVNAETLKCKLLNTYSPGALVLFHWRLDETIVWNQTLKIVNCNFKAVNKYMNHSKTDSVGVYQ